MRVRRRGRHRSGRAGDRARASERELTPRSGTSPEDRPPKGHRRAALESRRRGRLKKKLGFGTLGTVLAGLVAVVLVALVVDKAADLTGSDPNDGKAPAEQKPVVTLVYGTRESNPEAGAVWMALVTLDPTRDRGSVVYLPAHTAAEVPGRGLKPVGESLSSGGVPLLLVSTENLLGIPIDRYIELSDRAAQAFFQATGPISVNVPTEVRVGAGKNQARVLFEEGQQRLSAEFLVQLLYTRGLDSDDVELGARHLAFWDGLFETFADDPSELAEAVEEAGAALGDSDAEPKDHADVLKALAAMPSVDITISTVPVEQMSVQDSELYATDSQELEKFLEDTIGPYAAPRDDIRVQVLNGNGVPGIGQEVAEKLIGEGFRVLLPGNAPRLDYPNTLIITYDSSEEGQALAERARALLGLGKVRISVQQQGIVDLTIVVGKDWLRDH